MIERALPDYGLVSQGVELFGWGKAFCPLLPYQLAYLQHVHELDVDQCTLGRPKGPEPQYRTGDMFDASE
jgi:hypothetical protein